MIKELYQKIVLETTLNVTQSKIDSIRNKNVKKSGCRIYENGFIGVAGTLGDPTDETWKMAEENLSLKIPYEFQPEKNNIRTRDSRGDKISQDEFLKKSEYLLETLRNEFPQFIFSNKIKMSEVTSLLKNDCGLDYLNIDNCVTVELICKHVDSVNVFDSGVIFESREYDVDKLLTEAREQLSAFNKNVELPTCEKLPIVLDTSALNLKFYEALDAVALGTETSMFNTKMGEKAFCDNFNMYIDRTSDNTCISFFDNEGSVLSNDKFNLIENGTIVTGYSDKKNSKKYNVQNTAASGGAYDDVPTLYPTLLTIEHSDQTLQQMLAGKKAILVVMMSGGDCTNEGVFASPVQMSYLMDDGKIVGKLPEFNISASIYDAFGKDYIGVTADKPFGGQRVLVTNMNISK